MKKLILEELTLEQKLGMIFTAFRTPYYDHGREECEKWILDMIKKRALGSVWVQQGMPDCEEFISEVRKTADYPILIFTDAESGIGEYKIGKHNALGCTDSEEHAYAFGKALGVTARKKGYNVVCNPVIDLSVTGSARSIGSDKERIARLAAAEIRGMHDGGVLSVCKHYPSPYHTKQNDTHMEDVYSMQTKEDLLETSLYAYIKLNEQGLLDGIMTGHQSLPNIDPDYPTSLSKKVIDIIREQGFEGFTITDALLMKAISGTFGETESLGLAIAAGNTFPLMYNPLNEKNYNSIKTCFEKGMFTEKELDEAVKKVLETQSIAFEMYKETEISEQEHNLVKAINKDSVFAKTDEGINLPISKDGKHYFVLMVQNDIDIGSSGKIEVDTFSRGWYYPPKITERIMELFPNSNVTPIHEFPNNRQNHQILHESLEYEDIVFITFSEFIAYAGGEEITYRIRNLMNALQQKNRISTLVHFGNPCVLEPLPHFKRVIIGGNSAESVDACLDVLAGNYPAKGKLTYDVNLK